jgi:hypothetical protein
MKIEFSSPITAADSGRRIIAGRIVTFGEVGHTSAGPTVFEPGSITFGEDVHLMFEHDTTRPIGRSAQLTETPEGIDGVFRIAATSPITASRPTAPSWSPHRPSITSATCAGPQSPPHESIVWRHLKHQPRRKLK